MSVLTVIALLAAYLTPYSEHGEQKMQTQEVKNGVVRVVVETVQGRYLEHYYARKGSSWRKILESGSAMRPETSIRENGREHPLLKWRSVNVTRDGNVESLHLEASLEDGTVSKTISVRRGEQYARVALSYRIHKVRMLQSFSSTYSFQPGDKQYTEYKPLDFVFTPQLRPEKEHVIADHVFRSPALMMQKKGDFAALVPDLGSLDGAGRAIRTVADLQVETADRPFFSIGLQNWLPESYRLRNTHVFYVAPDSLAPTLKDTTISLSYLLFLRADAPERRGYTDVVRYHWRSSGEAYMQRAVGPQAEPFSSYIQKAWYQFVPQVALDATYQGQPVTLLRQARLAWSNTMHKEADNDSWFNVWFNALRTAYGMHLYGTAARDQNLVRRATNVLNLALLAPQQGGIAPTIFYLDSTGGHWVADHAWGGIEGGKNLPMFHNAWTCYWLLRWIDLVPQRKAEILKYTRAFGDFLVVNQRPSGVIPSWYNPSTLAPVEVFRDENAETAGAALFLAELYARTKDARYLLVAERSMRYMFTAIVPERKWFDYETFFSCSRKPVGFYDSYTQQQPQNTLSIHQAAEACCELFRLTGNEEYRARGTEILDYLCLYQQAWSPRWLSCELFGGFGVQNTDAEWSDSRQGYFAVTLIQYYELTGKKEYFERGVAALRSMFSLFESPSSPRTAENYGHSGTDRLAGVTGLHWGTGSSVVSIHLITNAYGDAYVDVGKGWGVGIDGCRITDVKLTKRTVSIDIRDNLEKSRTVRLKFGKMTAKEYDVTVNGKLLGRYTSTQLGKGINIAI